jgi:hypothetical protein
MPWIASACALSATLVAAVRIRDAKIEARRARVGEAVEPFVETPGPREIRLLRGGAARFEDFTLSFEEGRLAVRDRRGRRVVDFTRLDLPGPRGWNELQLDLLEVAPEAIAIRARTEPGAPCRGPGLYRWLRTGLRIEVPGTEPLVVTAWDEAGGALEISKVPVPPGTPVLFGRSRVRLEAGPYLSVELE